jgi:hypothetical protein
MEKDDGQVENPADEESICRALRRRVNGTSLSQYLSDAACLVYHK